MKKNNVILFFLTLYSLHLYGVDNPCAITEQAMKSVVNGEIKKMINKKDCAIFYDFAQKLSVCNEENFAGQCESKKIEGNTGQLKSREQFCFQTKYYYRQECKNSDNSEKTIICVHQNESENTKRCNPELQLTERSAWVWGTDFITDINQSNDKFINFCKNKGITKLFIGGKAVTQFPKELSSIIIKAANNGILTEILYGNHSWAFKNEHTIPMSKVDETVAFINQYSLRGKVVGIHFDIEPHGTPEWQGGQSQKISLEFLDLLYNLKKLTNKANIGLNIDIPISYDKSELKIKYLNQEKTLFEHILAVIDNITLMAYYDSPETIIEGVSFEIEKANQYQGKKKIIIGVQVSKVKHSINSFYDKGSAFMDKTLHQVAIHYKKSLGYGGIAIHSYNGYLSFK